jgi:hypothetical protein
MSTDSVAPESSDLWDHAVGLVEEIDVLRLALIGAAEVAAGAVRR